MSKKIQIVGSMNADTLDGKHASDFASATDVTALDAKVGESPVSEQISTAIENLNLSNNYANKEHGHEISEVTNLQSVLDGKQPIGDYATKTDAKNYANEKDNAISEAKKAGADAQIGVDALREKIGTVADGQTVVSMIEDAKISATYDDTAVKSDIDALERLVGDSKVADQISTAITGLNLPNTYASKSHKHIKSDITDFAHIHEIGEVNGLQNALNEKQPSGDYATKAEAQSYANAKDSVIADAKKAGTDAQSHSENVASNLAAEIARAKGAESSLDTRIDANEAAIIKINANSTTVGSVDYKIAQAVASIMENPDDTMNSINELVTWVDDHASDALALNNKVSANETAIGNLETKVGDTAVSTQITNAIANKVDKVSGKGLSTNDYTTTEKNKLSGIASGAEVNQNAFSNIIVGSTTIAADAKTDTLTLVAGSNVTITPDSANDKVTIAAKDTVYTHPTYTAKSEGLYKVTVDGTGHVSATTSVTKADITGLGIPSTNTTYSDATQSASGLMSKADKIKLDGVATGANKITVDTARSTTSTNPLQNKVINSALSALETKVGDTAVSAQITSATNNFIKGLSVSGRTVTYTKGDGTTGTITTQDSNTTYSDATQSASGLMSKADKIKLDGVATGANKTVVDTAMSSTSTNPVQNNVVTAALDGKFAKSGGQVSGDVTLYAASGDSPALNFQRGTLTDNYNDWRIQDRSGYLYFDQRGSGSTDWANILYFAQAAAVFTTPVQATRFDGPATKLTTTTAGSASKPVYFANGIPVACSTEIPTDSHINSLIDAKVNTVSALVGDTSVSSQISTAIANAIPSVTAADNGKFMVVTNGVWTAQSIQNAEEVRF